MSVLTVKPEFLYPISRQFPFDEVAEKIVRALEKRNWSVPKVKVHFDTYGSGEAKYKLVREIIGEDFKLCFCRIQRTLPDNVWNDTAALHEIFIPKQSIEVFDDESGPTYYFYVGQNWEEDKKWFMNSIKSCSKVRGEPRRYLRYTGKSYNSRPLELIADNDLGREYTPQGNEPQRINLEEKFGEFTKWLEEFVLNYILRFPEAEVIDEITTELIPYNGMWSKVHSLCSRYDAKRILQGKKDPNKLPRHERYVYFGSGKRLVPLDVRNNGRFPAIAREGFIWCDVNPNITINSQAKEITREVYFMMYSLLRDDNNIVSIKPKYANDVYVADNAKYIETREKIFDSIAPRDYLTDQELGEALAARGATIVPINEYKGDYKDPIVLICRELDFDEIGEIANTE